MSFPVFEDFDKDASDLFKVDDFKPKYTLKIKTDAPAKVVLTTNVELKDGKLVPKLSGTWSHDSGFKLEKLDIDSSGAISTETSFDGSASVPGLKLEFKGNDSTKGDLSFTYKSPALPATFTGSLDALSYSSATASVSSGSGALKGGADATLAFSKDDGKKVNLSAYGVGFSYTFGSVFTSLRVASVPGKEEKGKAPGPNTRNVTAIATYEAQKDLTIGAKADYVGIKGSSGYQYPSFPVASLAAKYKCNPDTTLRVLIGAKEINGLFIQSVAKGFKVTGTVKVPTTFAAKDLAFGVQGVLG